MAGAHQSAGLRSPLDAVERASWQARFNDMAIMRHFGAAFDLSDEYLTRITVAEPARFHMGGLGTTAINGATISGLIDCAVSATGITHFRGRKSGTVELSVHFLAPLAFAAFTVECVATRKTRSLLFAEARILDRRGRLCARGVGIVATAQESARELAQAERSDGVWHQPDGLAVLQEEA